MTSINRAAWKRIKERVAAYVPITVTQTWQNGQQTSNSLDDIRSLVGDPQPRTVSFFKGRSVGATMGMIDNLRAMLTEPVPIGLLERLADIGPLVDGERPDETDEQFRQRVRERYQRHRGPTDTERFRP